MPLLPGARRRARVPEAPFGTVQPSGPAAAATENPVEAVVPYSLRIAAGVAWRVVIVAVAAWGLFKVIAATTTIIIPVSVAILFTALLMPLMVLLNHKAHLQRHFAAAVTLLIGIVVVIGALSLAGGQLVSGIADLSDQMNAAVNQIQNWLSTGPLKLGTEQINQFITQGRQWLTDHSSTLTSGALSVGSSAGEFFAGTIIMLITLFFFLAEGDSIWAWFVRLLPRQTQVPIHEAFRRGWVSLGSYVKTQVLVAFIDASGIALGAALLGLPLVIPLMLIVFFASAVPLVGAVLSGALAVLLGLVVKGPTAALIMLGVVLLVQQVEGHLLQPLLMGKAVSLHPLAVLLGVAGFSFLLGIVGALFAVPIMAVTNTVWLYLKGHDKFPMLAKGQSALTSSARKLAAEDVDSPDEGQSAARSEHKQVGGVSPTELHEQEQTDESRREDRVEEKAEQAPRDSSH